MKNTIPPKQQSRLDEFDRKYKKDLLYAGSLSEIQKAKAIFVPQNQWIKDHLKESMQIAVQEYQGQLKDKFKLHEQCSLHSNPGLMCSVCQINSRVLYALITGGINYGR